MKPDVGTTNCVKIVKMLKGMISDPNVNKYVAPNSIIQNSGVEPHVLTFTQDNCGVTETHSRTNLTNPPPLFISCLFSDAGKGLFTFIIHLWAKFLNYRWEYMCTCRGIKKRGIMKLTSGLHLKSRLK